MEFEKKGLNPRASERSSSQDPKEIDVVHKLYKEASKGDSVQEKSFNQYAIENHTLQKSQHNRNQREITVLPSKIFGTKEKPLSNRDVARKQYQEATKHFIHAYQSYNKTSFFLKEAKESGEQGKINYFNYLYNIDLKNITEAINAMDHAKSNIKRYE